MRACNWCTIMNLYFFDIKVWLNHRVHQQSHYYNEIAIAHARTTSDSGRYCTENYRAICLKGHGIVTYDLCDTAL